jgi:hypothetical protein
MKFRIDLEYKIGNRKVTQKQWLDHLQNRAGEVTAHNCEAVIRCPVHGKPPSVTYTAGRYHIEGCCQAVVDATTRALRR